MQRALQDLHADQNKWFALIELVRRLLLPIFIVIDPGNLVSKPSIYLLLYHNLNTLTYTL